LNLGYNNLVLINEGKSVKIECLPPKELPENIIAIEWYNNTLKSIDPYHSQNIKDLLENSNLLIGIESDGSMNIENARPESSGYFSCELYYFEKPKDSSDPLKDTKYRQYLIEGKEYSRNIFEFLKET
jgi:hypothetical protein